MLAANETVAYATVRYIAGDTPALATELGTLAAGQNLPVRSVLGRITASKKLTLCNPAATDGSETAIGILVHATDASAADKGIQFYKTGNFFADALNWHAGFDTAAKKSAAFDGTALIAR